MHIARCKHVLDFCTKVVGDAGSSVKKHLQPENKTCPESALQTCHDVFRGLASV